VKKKFKSILSLVILLSAAVVTPAFQIVAESQVFSESQQGDQEEVNTVQRMLLRMLDKLPLK